MYFDPKYGYHANKTKGVATGNEPETMYAVMTGKRFGNRCCFDYGNSEADDKSDGAGTMEAIYFGNARWDVAIAEGHASEGANEGYKEAGCIEAHSCPFKGANATICDGPQVSRRIAVGLGLAPTSSLACTTAVAICVVTER